MPLGALDRVRACAHELVAMATTGLEYASSEYDRDRYARVRRIGEELGEMTFPDGFPQDVEFLADIGIVTPKVGCAAAAFDQSGRLLLVRRADNGRWALPSGWAEVNETASETALRELREETGLDGVAESLLGVFDNRRLGSRHPYHFWTLLFRVRITSGTPRPSVETTDVRFFARHALPEGSSRLRAFLDRAFSDSSEALFQ